jgi:predicted transcriptional regulator of viral defense system
MKHTNELELNPGGLGKLEREKYSAILRETKATVSVTEAAKILDLKQEQAAMLLALFARKGWLKQIHYGVYIPISPESLTSDVVAEDPFVIFTKLFSPRYIAGLNAANY